MQEHTFTGRIANLAMFSLVEFGTRASFKIEWGAQSPIACAVEGNVAREFIAHYCEGDMVAVTGVDEPRPSTVAANTPWLGRLRVHAVRVAEDAPRNIRTYPEYSGISVLEAGLGGTVGAAPTTHLMRFAASAEVACRRRSG